VQKKLFLILLSITINTQTASWAEYASNIHWSECAKTVSNDTIKNTAITCGAFLTVANLLPYITKKISESKYPKAFTFIHQELEYAGVDSKAVTIKGVGPYSWATTSTLIGTYLFVPENDLIEIENLLTEHPNSRLLNRYRFVINHEANHIRHKHLRKRIVPIITALSATSFIQALCAYAVNNNPAVIQADDIQYTFSVKQATIGAAISMIGSLTMLLTLGYFTRPQEQEADDTTRDDASLLNGGIQYFDEVGKITDHKSKPILGDLLSSHPSLQHRIKVLKDRIAVLNTAA